MPASSDLQASSLSLGVLTVGAHPLVTTTPTPTITPTSTPLPCGLAWNVIDSLSPGPTTNYLFGVAPVSANDAWAVGVYCLSSPCYTLVEHWDGTQWSIVPSPNPSTASNLLNDIEAVSANDVWAVGYYHTSTADQTLVEHWDGTQWSVIPSPNTGITMTNALRQLEVVSANDIWAVGYYESGGYPVPLIEHWDGTQWSIVPCPSLLESELWAVSAVSANDVWAVENLPKQGMIARLWSIGMVLSGASCLALTPVLRVKMITI